MSLLTAQEASLLYKNAMYRDISRNGLIFDVNALKGGIIDRYGNTITNTAVLTKQVGGINCMVFDGNTTKLDLGSDLIGVSDFSLVAWVYADSVGETAGRIIANNKFEVYIDPGGALLTVRNIGSGTSASSGVFSLRRWLHLVVTRASGTNGLVNFYFNGVQSGTANQPAETPVVGTANVTIGALPNGTREWDGLMAWVRGYNKVLTITDAMQLFNSTKWMFSK